MTRPEHTMKYMQSNYRKYQFFALACAVLTVVASILAVFSGIRINALIKTSARAPLKISDAQATAAVKELDESRRALELARGQLNAEKDQNAVLKARVADLEQRLYELKKSPRIDNTSGTLKPVQSTPAASGRLQPRMQRAEPPGKPEARLQTGEAPVQLQPPPASKTAGHALQAAPSSSVTSEMDSAVPSSGQPALPDETGEQPPVHSPQQ